MVVSLSRVSQNIKKSTLPFWKTCSFFQKDISFRTILRRALRIEYDIIGGVYISGYHLQPIPLLFIMSREFFLDTKCSKIRHFEIRVFFILLLVFCIGHDLGAPVLMMLLNLVVKITTSICKSHRYHAKILNQKMIPHSLSTSAL